MSAAYGTKKPERVVDPAVSTGMPDLKSLCLPQDFAAKVGVKKRLVNVPVIKPHKSWFVRSRPGVVWRTRVAMIALKEEGESYVVHPDLAADLPDDVAYYDLVTAINRHGTVFLWPLPVPDGLRRNSWPDSRIAACQLAETRWVRVMANMKAGAYDVFEATGKLPEPEWPEEDFDTLFRLAFRDRVIESIDHAVILQLKGAA